MYDLDYDILPAQLEDGTCVWAYEVFDPFTTEIEYAKVYLTRAAAARAAYLDLGPW